MSSSSTTLSLDHLIQSHPCFVVKPYETSEEYPRVEGKGTFFIDANPDFFGEDVRAYEAPSSNPVAAITRGGRGVFAKRDILQGEIVTVFSGQLDTSGIDVWIDEKTRSVLYKANKDYVFQMEGRLRIIGFSRKQVKSPHGIGQLICDVASPVDSSDESVVAYLLASSRFANVTNNDNNNEKDGKDQAPPRPCFTATRDIAKDEQLFYSYGLEFWLARLGLSKDAVQEKLDKLVQLQAAAAATNSATH